MVDRRLTRSGGRVAGRVVAAGSPLGGDWLDVVRTPDERTVLVVGDVVGHGAEAVEGMSEFRDLLRSDLLDGSAASSAIAELNQLAHDRGTFATCCCVEVSAFDVTVASAGHPPPIVATDERALVLPGRPGPPLGVAPGIAYETSRIDVHPTDTLVLYTDGLVEQPGTTITDGIARLQRAAARVAHADLDEFADRLLGLAGPAHGLRDDVAVLAWRPEPSAGAEPGPRPGPERAARQGCGDTSEAWWRSPRTTARATSLSR